MTEQKPPSPVDIVSAAMLAHLGNMQARNRRMEFANWMMVVAVVFAATTIVLSVLGRGCL